MKPRPHRKRILLRPERMLYVTASLLAVSGAGWLVSHYCFAGHGELGELPSPWEPWWMRLHGAAMMLFFVSFGALLPGHVAHGLRRAINATSGIAMLAIVGALTLTGYGLYYLDEGTARAWTGIAHWIIGIAGVVALWGHVALGRWRKRAAARCRCKPVADRAAAHPGLSGARR